MCIRDSDRASAIAAEHGLTDRVKYRAGNALTDDLGEQQYDCLLYTSDAADERSSVDLGGRRIIKKKTK